MIMTFDFILTAKHSKDFMERLKTAVSGSQDTELCTDILKMCFHSKSQTVSILPVSDTCAFRHKIIPQKITYQALEKMLNGDWDHLAPGDIMDL